jgi:hypothetical protein
MKSLTISEAAYIPVGIDDLVDEDLRRTTFPPPPALDVTVLVCPLDDAETM